MTMPRKMKTVLLASFIALMGLEVAGEVSVVAVARVDAHDEDVQRLAGEAVDERVRRPRRGRPLRAEVLVDVVGRVDVAVQPDVRDAGSARDEERHGESDERDDAPRRVPERGAT